MKQSHNLAQEVLARPAAEAGPPQNESVEECKYPPVDRRKTAFDPQVMQQLLDGEFSEIRNLVKQLITKPDFHYYDGTDVQVYRQKVLGWIKRIAEAGIGRIFMPRYVDGEENLPKFMAAFETLALHDTSLLIKLGVEFGLFAASIQRLGVEYHHRKYLPDAAVAKNPQKAGTYVRIAIQKNKRPDRSHPAHAAERSLYPAWPSAGARAVRPLERCVAMGRFACQIASCAKFQTMVSNCPKQFWKVIA